jgi:hypothetical protein
MIFNHLWGLYTHPLEEWQTIDNCHENMRYSLSHIIIIALIPSIMWYYSSVYLGWKMGVGDAVYLTHNSALLTAVVIYTALILGIFALAYLVHWIAVLFGVNPSYTQTLELSAYTVTPLFMSTFSAFYPEFWFVVSAGMVALAYSIYLLYTGIPILMHIPEERGFLFASSVIACGLILLVMIIAVTAMLWTSGLIRPTFT